MTEKMDVLEIVLPVLVMIILGMLCRKWKLLDQNGVNNMKTLVTNIMLPVAIFHALATAKYSGKIGTLVLIMFIMLLISFGVGFLLKRFMEEPYKKYLPFLVCIYEGGMMAYPLYTSLCGSENLSQIAVLDIAGLLFGFSVYMGMLGQTENGEKINAKSLFYSALKTPAFIGTVLGIIAGLTGLINRLMDSSFGPGYLSAESILTTAITPIILIVVGYSMELVPELIRTLYQNYFSEDYFAGSDDNGSSYSCEISGRKFQTFESGNYYIYVVSSNIQYADISEKERKQCICFYNKFIVLYCFDSGLYCVGSGRVIKRKEGI